MCLYKHSASRPVVNMSCGIASWSIEEGICLSFDGFILECFLSVAAKSLQRALYIWLNLRVVDAPCCQSPPWLRQKTCHKYGSIIANFIWLSAKTRGSACTRGPDSGVPNALKLLKKQRCGLDLCDLSQLFWDSHLLGVYARNLCAEWHFCGYRASVRISCE